LALLINGAANVAPAISPDCFTNSLRLAWEDEMFFGIVVVLIG
jgi:hypothetical protein